MQGAQAIAVVAALGGELAAPAIALCDQEGCKQPAKFKYMWEWGVGGVCCETHQFTLNQTAGNISRSIQFQQLDAGAPVPLGRDERIQLIARALTLDAELAEAKLRGLEMYNHNVSLTAQVHSLTTVKRELEAQLKDAHGELIKMDAELTRRRAENAELADEAGRLRVLMPRQHPTQQELDAQERLAGPSTSRGEERTSVGLGPEQKPNT